VKFFWLNVHVDYACRDSGICCTSGWPIPVERTRVAAIDDAISRRAIPLRVTPWLAPQPNAPDDVAGTIALGRNGHCVFFEARGSRCAIHDVKPSSCVHFPYVCLIDQRGVGVNLSHYCPTAASMLFEHGGPIEIVEGPSPVPPGVTLEGLDARESLPPASPAAPPRLMSFETFSAWERDEIACANIADWQSDDRRWFEHARAAVPPPWTWQPAPADPEGAWWSLVAPAWHRFEDVRRRYAAAKVFASWAAYEADGLAAIRRGARIAAAVLRVESARQCLLYGQPLDRELLMQAIQQSDLLLAHYADPRQLFASV
jgi:Fe-S-cluster containining protein